MARARNVRVTAFRLRSRGQRRERYDAAGTDGAQAEILRRACVRSKAIGDGTLRLPDFTVTWRGETFFWEHLGRLDLTDYAEKWEKKRAWYERWFPGQLLTTKEGPQLSKAAATVIDKLTQGAAAVD